MLEQEYEADTKENVFFPFKLVQSSSLEKSYRRQKEKIKEIKKEQSEYKLGIETEIDKQDLGLLTLRDSCQWRFSAFDVELYDGEELPLMGDEWEDWDSQNFLSNKGFEMRHNVLKSILSFNHAACGLEIQATFTLEGEASFWLFTRAPENDRTTDCYTALVKVLKESKSRRSFLSFSTFVQELNGALDLKTFSKKQLISLGKPNNYYLENDLNEYRLHLIDDGSETIRAQLNMNDGKENNSTSANFFLPTEHRGSILLAGLGQSCIIKSFICKSFVKQDLDSPFTSDRKNCECCLIC